MKPQASPTISPPGTAEPETLRLARTGDPEAFAALYNEHRAEVHTYISRRVHNADLADDLTQDVFVRALRRLSTFSWQGRDFGAWLITIARNIVIDHFKRSSTQRETSVSEFFDAGEAASAEEIVVAEMTTVEQRVAIGTALSRLTPGQRAAVVLRYLQDKSVRESAVELGMDEGALKTLTWRAATHLRRSLLTVRAAA